jgi:hypothetical protein
MNILFFLATQGSTVPEVSTSSLLVAGGLMAMIAVVRLVRRKDR